MKQALIIRREELNELVADEVRKTTGYQSLIELAYARSTHDLGVALGGERDEVTSGALASFRRSLKTRAPSKAADDVADGLIRLRAQAYRKERPTDDALVNAAIGAVKQTAQRVGRLLGDDPDARFYDFEQGEENPAWREDAGSVFLVGDDAPPGLALDDVHLFGETEGAVVEWGLRETVNTIHCALETPGSLSDDIILQGYYRYRGVQQGMLEIPPVENNFDAGTQHSYDDLGKRIPHSRVVLNDSAAHSYYLSSHVLTESDAWTEVAEFVATFLQELIGEPMATIGGAVAGQSGVPGAGFVGGLMGGAVDAAIDAMSDDLLTRVGRHVHDFVYDVIAAVGVSDNIYFEPWLTGVHVSWPTEGVPRWRTVHAIRDRGPWLADPSNRNPRHGAGLLRPGRARGQSDMVLHPVPRLENGDHPSGSYWYNTTVNVRRVETPKRRV